MKTATFRNQAAQGDLLIRKIDRIPPEAKPVPPQKGRYIVAHSETGHNHVIEAAPNVSLLATGDPLVTYLEVIEATDRMETLIRHLRPFDTHETISIPPGSYEIRRQREYTPEGWRMVQD
jgi:hypothetical protein